VAAADSRWLTVWLLVLLAVALFIGLRSRRFVHERGIILGAAVLMLSYVAVTKHLL
jgi:hypothetical protein